MITTITQTEKKETRSFKIVFAGMLLFLAMVTSMMVSGQKYNGHYLNNVDAKGIILDGYDPVAFFTDNKPVKGDPQFSYTYEEAVYHFASQQHLDLFKANPEKYKPQFGAWCAYAVSLGRTAPIDVNTFSIVDGRLVIQHNQRAVNGWEKNPEGNLKLADKYWPRVTANGGKQIKVSGSNTWLYLAAGGIVLLLIATIVLLRKRSASSRMSSKHSMGSMAASKM